jgi:hypothetical protein
MALGRISAVHQCTQRLGRRRVCVTPPAGAHGETASRRRRWVVIATAVVPVAAAVTAAPISSPR